MALILLIIVLSVAIPGCRENPTPVSNDSVSANRPVAADAEKQNSEGKAPSSSAVPPKIISREDWKAKEPVGSMRSHRPSRITIHHTASPQKENVPLERKMRNLQSFSQTASTLSTGKLKQVWPDVPYHFYIAVEGGIAEGRKVEYVGDTNTEYDPTGHILIVLEGNFEIEQPSPRQLQSLRALVLWLANRWSVPARDIKGHKDYAKTACPGKNLVPEILKLQQAVAK